MTDERLAHIASHLPPQRSLTGRYGRDDLMALMPFLVRPLTLDEIGAEMGMTRKHVETRWYRLMDMMGFERRPGPASTVLARMALLRIVVGLDPCWCEA